MCIIVVYGEISLGFVHFELNLDRNKMEKNINIFCFVVKKKHFAFKMAPTDQMANMHILEWT